MSLTLDEVRQIRFRMTRRGESGYQVVDVDTFIDKVELTFDEFDKERERLHRELESVQSTSVQPAVGDASGESAVNAEELEAKNREIADLRAEVERLNGLLSQAGDSNAVLQASENRVRELTAENDSLRTQLEQVRGEFDRARSERLAQVAASTGTEQLVVTASADAAPAVTRMLQMAADQATTLMDEAQAEATRKLTEAEQRANEIKTDARTRADRIESEARVNAEQMTREAEAHATKVTQEADARAAMVDQQANDRRAELFSDLEAEQEALTGKVDALRSFESSYRSNLTSSLQRLLTQVEQDRPEPVDVPELAANRSETPRLDALANKDMP